jgi:hypothetical protein
MRSPSHHARQVDATPSAARDPECGEPDACRRPHQGREAGHGIQAEAGSGGDDVDGRQRNYLSDVCEALLHRVAGGGQ